MKRSAEEPDAYDAVVFVNGHSDIHTKEQETVVELKNKSDVRFQFMVQNEIVTEKVSSDLSGILQNTICLAELGMPTFNSALFIREHLFDVMLNAFSIPLQETCTRAIKKIVETRPDDAELKSYKFDQSKGLCSNVPTHFVDKSWQFFLSDKHDGVYVLDRKEVDKYIKNPKMLNSFFYKTRKKMGLKSLQPDKIVEATQDNLNDGNEKDRVLIPDAHVMYKSQLMLLLKQMGYKRVLIIDGGCLQYSKRKVDKDFIEMIKSRGILGGRKTRRLKRRS